MICFYDRKRLYERKRKENIRFILISVLGGTRSRFIDKRGKEEKYTESGASI